MHESWRKRVSHKEFWRNIIIFPVKYGNVRYYMWVVIDAARFTTSFVYAHVSVSKTKKRSESEGMYRRE